MLDQIKGIKMMGLQEYFARTVQILRNKELKLSVKFRMLITHLVMLCTRTLHPYLLQTTANIAKLPLPSRSHLSSSLELAFSGHAPKRA
jgi:hypothetical protein